MEGYILQTLLWAEMPSILHLTTGFWQGGKDRPKFAV
jgi:hypothetical protein